MPKGLDPLIDSSYTPPTGAEERAPSCGVANDDAKGG